VVTSAPRFLSIRVVCGCAANEAAAGAGRTTAFDGWAESANEAAAGAAVGGTGPGCNGLLVTKPGFNAIREPELDGAQNGA